MDDGTTPAGACACPHINRDDQRCGNRFTLTRLDQAFTVCLGSFNACPMYHRINCEISSARNENVGCMPRVTLTTNGSTSTLRRTGT